MKSTPPGRHLRQTMIQKHEYRKALRITRASTSAFVDTLTGKSACGYSTVPNLKLASLLRDAQIVLIEDGRDDFTNSIERLIFNQAVRIWIDGQYAYRNLEDLRAV